MQTCDELPPDDDIRLSAKARALIVEYRARQAADPRIAVSRKVSQAMQGIGPSYHVLLEQRGELHVYRDGSAVRVSVASIFARLIRLAIETHPADGPEAKVRRPSSRFRRGIRPRTEAELQGLRKGNEKRRLEAEERRAKAAVSRSD